MVLQKAETAEKKAVFFSFFFTATFLFFSTFFLINFTLAFENNQASLLDSLFAQPNKANIQTVLLRRNIIANKLTFNKTKSTTAKSVLNVNIYTVNKHRSQSNQITTTSTQQQQQHTNNLVNSFNSNNVQTNNFECNISSDFKLDQKAFLSPTVLKATAIERIKYYQSNTSMLKSYSIIFKIERVFKLNDNKLVSSNGDDFWPKYFSKFNPQASSKHLQIGSYLLVDNLNLNLNNCHTLEIKLNKSYLLYLNKNENYLTQEFFNHPMRFNANYDFEQSNSKRKERPKLVRFNKVFYNNDLNNNRHKIKAQPPQKEKINFNAKYATFLSTVILVKIPILSIASKPVEILSNYMEAITESVLCNKCEKEVTVKIDKKKTDSWQLAGLGQSLNIRCDFDGNPKPEITWEKGDFNNQQHLIQSNSKYLIETFENYSVLTINSVSINDQSIYTCVAKDFTTNTFKSDKFKLFLNRQNHNAKLFSTTTTTKTFFQSKSAKFTKQPPLKLKNEETELVFEVVNSNQRIPTTTADMKPVDKPERKSFHSFAPSNDYIVCPKEEDICQNRGICYRAKLEARINKTAPNYKFCICQSYYEGEFCEIELLSSMNGKPEEITGSLHDLWEEFKIPEKVTTTTTTKSLSTTIRKLLFTRPNSTKPNKFKPQQKLFDYKKIQPNQIYKSHN